RVVLRRQEQDVRGLDAHGRRVAAREHGPRRREAVDALAERRLDGHARRGAEEGEVDDPAEGGGAPAGRDRRDDDALLAHGREGGALAPLRGVEGEALRGNEAAAADLRAARPEVGDAEEGGGEGGRGAAVDLARRALL